MQIKEHTIQLSTAEPIAILDITGQVKSFVKDAGLTDGVLHIASAHTTLGIALNERCEQLQQDMRDFFQRLAPPDADYRHNRVAVDGRPNAHSHLLATFIPSQLSLVLRKGALQLGAWQSVFAIELDGPRPERKITLSLMGV